MEKQKRRSFTTEKTWRHVWVKEVKGRWGKTNWLLNGTSALVTEGKKKAVVLNITFISVFTSKTGPEKSKTLESWQWGERNLFCFYWFLQLSQSAGLFIIPVRQKKMQAISPHPSQNTKLQFEKKKKLSSTISGVFSEIISDFKLFISVSVKF